MRPKQKVILAAISSYIEQHKFSPSVRDLCKIVGLKSSSTLHGHLEVLKKKGIITWEESRPRTIKIIPQEINL